jgi:hypothetical protein
MGGSTLLSLLPLLLASQAVAQAAPQRPADEQELVVEGRRAELSSWREAETPHVVVISNGSESELVRVARNLERLHFLLSGLLGMAGKTDDTVKLRVTLVGDTAEFEGMGLRNVRWQQGPYAADFQPLRYYDPREDGAVLATSRIDQKVVLDQGVSLQSLSTVIQSVAAAGDAGAAAQSGIGSSALVGLSNSSDLVGSANEKSFALPSDHLLYAAYAQHFLTTYFPAAYPRWYLDGFGQVFASMAARGDTQLEFGRAPIGTSATLSKYGDYPIERLLNGTYLEEKPSRTRWTPAHAWLLTHFLFFSDTRRPQLNRYLLGYANGASAAEAMSAFGDLKELAQELRRYYRAKKPFERITYPAAQADEPVVRRLSKGQAAFVKGRLELGSRLEIPAAPQAKVDADTAAKMNKARNDALAERDRWLDRLRLDAQRYPAEREAQLLLTEAECRIGNTARCLAGADRALALAPNDGAAQAWKGIGMAQEAASLTGEPRQAKLRAARAVIAKANRADTNAVLPLLAYYRSYAGAESPAPALAVDAMAGVVARVPNAPGPRVTLGSELAAHKASEEARRTLRPVAAGGWDAPERAKAREILQQVGNPAP